MACRAAVVPCGRVGVRVPIRVAASGAWCVVQSGRSVVGFGSVARYQACAPRPAMRDARIVSTPGIGDSRGLCERCRGGRQHDELHLGECVRSDPVHGLSLRIIYAEHGRCRAWRSESRCQGVGRCSRSVKISRSASVRGGARPLPGWAIEPPGVASIRALEWAELYPSPTPFPDILRRTE